MKFPAVVFKWDGQCMRPFASGAAAIAEKTYTSGHAYRLIVQEERDRSKQRTLDQNARMWAMLGEVAEQYEHCGRKYDANQWKCLFMHALGQEIAFLPALDGKTFVPYGHQSTSKMSKTEMSELIEFIIAWCAQHGVHLRDDPT